jgi:hypothetical protein
MGFFMVVSLIIYISLTRIERSKIFIALAPDERLVVNLIRVVCGRNPIERFIYGT